MTMFSTSLCQQKYKICEGFIVSEAIQCNKKLGVSNLPFHSVCTWLVWSQWFLVRITGLLRFFQSHGQLTGRETVQTVKEKLSHGPVSSVIRNVCLGCLSHINISSIREWSCSSSSSFGRVKLHVCVCKHVHLGQHTHFKISVKDKLLSNGVRPIYSFSKVL